MPGQRIIAVIPARLASSRLPEKPLAEISGKPLIAWVIENARRAKSLEEILVATDDARIVAAARECGVAACMTRADHPSGTDRIAEAITGLEADIVVNVQGDEPEIAASTIDAVAALVKNEPSIDIGTAAIPLTTVEEYQSPHRVKVVIDHSGHALYFSRSPIPYWRGDGETTTLDAQLAAGGALAHIGLYAYRRVALERLVRMPPSSLEKWERLEQLRAMQAGMRIGVVTVTEHSPGIDTPEDLATFRRRMAGTDNGGTSARWST